MAYLIIGYILIVIICSLVKKVNGYEAFISGVKEGSITVINMFANLLGFVLVVECIKGCGILDDLGAIFNPYLFIQGFIRPLSASSSLAIMLDTYETFGVDHPVAIISTLIHATADTTFYIIVMYFSSCEIKEYHYAFLMGAIVNIIAYLIIGAVFVIFL